MANIIVAGGAGFIGSHLCKRLIDEGHAVFCLDNLITGDKNNNTPLLDNPKFTFLEYDVTQPFSTIDDRFAEIDYIFHLASPASPNKNSERSYVNYPVETLLVNSIGTYNLLQIAKSRNAGFLFASTSEVYGNPNVSPQPETYYGNVNPNGVRSMYDEGKRFGEAMTMTFKRKYDLNTRIVRIFNTYGPNMQKDDGRVVSNFINQALQNEPLTIYGDGTQTRSFCYVDDLVEGLMQAMFHENTNGEVINLGNPEEKNMLEIAKLIKEYMSVSVENVHQPLPEDDPLHRKPDISKAKQLLNWEPRISLEEGLKKTIEYFRNA
jgi:nucleoside-diphosphate-sugar epimerase